MQRLVIGLALGLVMLCSASLAQPADSSGLSTIGSAVLSSSDNLAVGRGHVFAGCFHQGLRVFDVTNASAPFEEVVLFSGMRPAATDIVGNLAYVTEWNDGLRIVSLGNPHEPVQLGFVNGFHAYTAQIQGNYAFAAAWSTGLVVVDISDPTAPFIADSLNIGHRACRAVVSGNYAYLLDYQRCLMAVNISNPLAPFATDSVIVVGSHERMIVAQGSLFVLNVTGTTSSLITVSLALPMHPAITGTYSMPGHASDLATFSHYLSVVSDSGGLMLFDVADPPNPQQIGWYHPGAADMGGRVCMDSSYIYLGYGGQLRVLDYSVAQDVPNVHTSTVESPALNPAYPNPFNATTTISFDLPTIQTVSLDAFDVTGRHVLTLANGLYSAGHHEVAVNGTALASGIYFVRLHAGEFVTQQKIVLIK